MGLPDMWQTDTTIRGLRVQHMRDASESPCLRDRAMQATACSPAPRGSADRREQAIAGEVGGERIVH
jgi:hypothetical protein